jgi:hypothetical protein
MKQKISTEQINLQDPSNFKRFKEIERELVEGDPNIKKVFERRKEAIMNISQRFGHNI